MSFSDFYALSCQDSPGEVSLCHGDGCVHVELSCQIGGDGRGEGAAGTMSIASVDTHASVAGNLLAFGEEVVYLLCAHQGRSLRWHREVTALDEHVLAAQLADSLGSSLDVLIVLDLHACENLCLWDVRGEKGCHRQ